MKRSQSHHFDGKRYQNSEHKASDTSRIFRHLFRWLITRKPSKWPKRVKIKQHKIPISRVGKGDLRSTFINHSTVLIQMDGLNILTDPIWSKRCGPMRWAGLKRVAPPGVRFEDLPPIDIVLISHNHYDHMDIPTLRKLQRAHHPLFCVSKGNKELLTSKRIKNVVEFDWWQQQTLLDRLPVTYVPAQHFSRRGLWDRNKTLWGGFVLEGAKGPVYFAGDTAYGKVFKDLFKKFGAMRLAILPIGAYLPRWFMKSVHMDPNDAVKAHLDLHAKHSLAIHFGTFHLSDEAIDEPIRDLVTALKHHELREGKFLVLQPGEGHQFS